MNKYFQIFSPRMPKSRIKLWRHNLSLLLTPWEWKHEIYIQERHLAHLLIKRCYWEYVFPCSSHLCPFSSLTGLCWWSLIKESNNHMQRPWGEATTVTARDHEHLCVAPTGSDNRWFMAGVTIEDNEAPQWDSPHPLSSNTQSVTSHPPFP